MLATAMRLVAYFFKPLALPAILLASIALFLAFLLAAHRMIEWADGRTQLGALGFAEQLLLARAMLWRVAVLMAIVSLAVFLFVSPKLAPAVLLGFDGIAFEHRSKLPMVWSSILAAIVFLLVVQAATSEKVSVRGALKELAARSAWLAPAIAAVLIVHLGLSFLQGGVRYLVALVVEAGAPPIYVYFPFICGFAIVRLCATLAILTFALRESYRGPRPAPPAPIGRIGSD